MRYIDADALIEDIQETVCGKCGDISDGIKCKSCGIDDTLDFLENAPTADVVPKSEVKWLESEVDRLLLLVDYNHSVLEQEVQDAKAEAAREIFEEIEIFLYMHFRFCKEEIGNNDTKYFEGRLELNTQIQNFIDELKKEHIG